MADTNTMSKLAATADRLRGLAARCRDAADLTVIPEVHRELGLIAERLDDEAAELAARR